MHHISRFGTGAATPTRTIALIAAVILIAAACGAGSAGENLQAQPIDPTVLAEYGKFELVDAKLASVGSAQALDSARRQDYGRPGTPEVVLVRSLDPTSELVTLPAKELIWVFHWGGLAEEQTKGFPGSDGATPQVTVFNHTDYFLFVKAEDGAVIASVLH